MIDQRLARHAGQWLQTAYAQPGVRLVLVIVVVGALLSKIDTAALRTQLAGFDPVAGAAMLVVNLAITALFACRWWIIARTLGFVTPYREFARATWLSQCVSELGPALLIGEIARYQQLRQYGDPWQLAASQLLDRLSGHLVLGLIALGLMPWYWRWYTAFPSATLGSFLLLTLMAVGLGGLLARRFWPVARLHPREVLGVCDPLRAPGHYALSFAIQLLLSGNLALAAAGLGVPASSVGTVLLLGPLLLLGTSTLPGLISDWGKRELLALVLLAPAGTTAEQSVALSLIYGLIHLLSVLPAALLLSAVRRRQSAKRAPHASGD